VIDAATKRIVATLADEQEVEIHFRTACRSPKVASSVLVGKLPAEWQIVMRVLVRAGTPAALGRLKKRWRAVSARTTLPMPGWRSHGVRSSDMLTVRGALAGQTSRGVLL